jgi:hypothetical protein
MTPTQNQTVIYDSKNNQVRLRVRLITELHGRMWLAETLEPNRYWATGKIITVHSTDIKEIER